MTWGSRYGNLPESFPCSSCGLMISDPKEHGKFCRGRLRDAEKCEYCGLMITKDGGHKCVKQQEAMMFEQKKRIAEAKERAKVRAKERRERLKAGTYVTSRAKCIKPKETMTFMDVILDGYGDNWREITVEKNPWMCRICGLVWQTKHEAEDCGFERMDVFVQKKAHKDSYTKLYGARYFENGVPRGPGVKTIEFRALRRLTPDATPEEIAMWKKEDEETERKRAEFEDAQVKRVQKSTKGALVYGDADPYEDAYDRYVKESTSSDEAAKEAGLERINPSDETSEYIADQDKRQYDREHADRDDDDPNDTWAGTEREF